MTDGLALLSTGLLDYASLRPEQLQPALEHLLDANLTALARIVTDHGQSPGWDDLVLAVERLDQRLEDHFHSLVPLVYEGEQWALAVDACNGLLLDWNRRKHEHPGLYEAYQRLDKAALDVEQRVVLSRIFRGFRLGGFQLGTTERTQLRETDAAIAALEQQFMANLNNARDGWSHLLSDEAQLSGLSDAHRQRLRKRASEAGLDGWWVDLGETTVELILERADDRALRELIYRASTTLATDRGRDQANDNVPVLRALLRLRHERARLLGLANAAEQGLELKAARTTLEVEAFLEGLIKGCRPRLQADLRILQARASQQGFTAIQPWDFAYLSRCIRDEATANLGVLDRFALEGALSVFWRRHERLFGIRLSPCAASAWHPDVRVLEVTEDDRLLGYIYLDLHERPGKLPWPYCYPMRQRHEDTDGTLTVPTALVSCCFGHGADLSHTDLCKVFHECGHAMHQLLVNNRHRLLNRTVPSMLGPDGCEFVGMLTEQWCWSAPVLQEIIAATPQTIQVSQEQLRQWLSARRRLQAVTEARQLRLAWFDFIAHRDDAVRHDLRSLARRASEYVGLPESLAQDGFAESFDYLVTGYEAGYYSYKWAQAHAIDAFTRFEQDGVDQRAVAQDLRRKIIAKGGLRDLSASFDAFVGRSVSFQAYQRWHEPA